MARSVGSEDPKVAVLREARCLNPHPEAVTDEVFRSQEFFDARDAVQVKYEMVRRGRGDGGAGSPAAAAVGGFRPPLFQAGAALPRPRVGGAGGAEAGPPPGRRLHTPARGLVHA